MGTETSLRKIFLKASDIGDPIERARYLDAACGTDSKRRQQVEALLAAEAEVGEASESCLSSSLIPDPFLNTRVPGYKLLQQIGEGGCGVVYMAEQEKPIFRRVAIKLIKLGMDTKQVLARFDAERQALALMDHPNIAKIFDGGTTETGRPFFALELVRGIPITQFCDERHFSTQQRLNLFIRVCHAVQHAHQKGVIHRDLKPSNVLVTEIDGHPFPKIIDFGIAKALEGKLVDQTLFTSFEQFLGTPAYMSPEQSTVTAADIDTRSDIYSLGVLLYELLSGNTPFETKALAKAGLDELRRTIREIEPLPPSKRLSSLDRNSATTIARSRESEAPRLINLLKGDLDWIVMKCLEKDRGRRYESAHGLAMDIQRHLRCEPVIARPPSPTYILYRSIQRNRLKYTAAAAILLSLIIGFAVALWQYQTKAEALVLLIEAEKTATDAQNHAESERNHAERLGAEALLESGQAKLEAGDSHGLLDFIEAYRLAEHSPSIHETVGARWTTWQTEWERRTIAVCDTTWMVSDDWLLFVTGLESPLVTVHDTLTGASLSSALEHESDVSFAVFSPDESLLATITMNGVIRLWNWRLGQLMKPPINPEVPGLTQLSFNPDGNLLAAIPQLYTSSPVSTDVAVVRLDTAAPEIHILNHRYFVSGGQFSPSGEFFAVRATPDIHLYRTSDFLPFGPSIASGFSRLLDFSRVGNHLVYESASSNELVFMEPKSGKITKRFPPLGSSSPEAVTFTHNGDRFAMWDWDSRLSLWRVDEPSRPYATRNFHLRYRSLAFSPDDSLLVAADSGPVLHILRTSDSSTLYSFRARSIKTVRFFENGILAMQSPKQSIFWDLKQTPLPKTALPHEAGGFSMAFSPSGEFLAVGSKDELRIWNRGNLAQGARIVPVSGRVEAITPHQNGQAFLVFTDEGTLLSLEPHTGETTTIREFDRGYQMSARLSPDGNRLALIRYKEGQIIDTQSGHTTNLEQYEGFRSLAFRADSQHLSIGMASWKINHFDLKSPGVEFLGQSQNLGGWAEAVTYHPSGEILAVCVEGREIRLIDPTSHQQRFRSIQPYFLSIWVLEFSPDGSLLATAGSTPRGEYGIELWHFDHQRGLYRACSPLHADLPVWSLAFSPDSHTLASGGLGATTLWQIPQKATSLNEMESRSWNVTGFRPDEFNHPNFAQPSVSKIVDQKYRITRQAESTPQDLERTLTLPVEKALIEAKHLADQNSHRAIYHQVLGHLHRERMIDMANNRNWDAALTHAEEAIRLGFDDPYTQAQCALIALGANDFSRYQERCRKMVAQYATTLDPTAVRWIAGAVALHPGALEDYSSLIEQIRQTAPRAGGLDKAVFNFYLGAVLTRAERYKEALAEFTRVDEHYKIAGESGNFAPAHYEFGFVICHARLGQSDEAKHWFEFAMRDAQDPRAPGRGTGSWEISLSLELLQSEATAAMLQATPQAQ